SSSKCSFNTRLRFEPRNSFGEQRFPLLDRLTAQIFSVEFKQIECAKHGTGERAMAADQVKDSKSVLIADDRFAVDQAGANRKLGYRHCDEGKARREIVSGARNEPHTGPIASGQYAEAVMFDFVNPAGAGRRGLRG